MLRQKISSECRPHNTSGRARSERMKAARGGTKRATSMTSAKNEMSRIGDRLPLLIGQREGRRRLGIRSELLEFEDRDSLRLSVFEDSEIRGFQSLDDFAGFVLHGDVDGNERGSGAEGRRSAGGDLRLLLAVGRKRRYNHGCTQIDTDRKERRDPCASVSIRGFKWFFQHLTRN